jgi:catechol 2,3-dioxygenase-like lactoylglutathione lyase family enzyme
MRNKMALTNTKKATAVGINHVALEVESIDEALDFYSTFLDFEIESKSDEAAFIYFGDQFINFMTGRTQEPDNGRHFGIAVDDKELVREALSEMGVELLALNPKFLDFLDPWGNRIEITTYRNIQFSKTDHVLKGMGLSGLDKTENALTELRAKNMAP